MTAYCLSDECHFGKSVASRVTLPTCPFHDTRRAFLDGLFLVPERWQTWRVVAVVGPVEMWISGQGTLCHLPGHLSIISIRPVPRTVPPDPSCTLLRNEAVRGAKRAIASHVK